MSRRLAHDFSHVRIHRDETAARAARAVHAQAFAVGSHLLGVKGRMSIPEQWDLNDFGPLAFQVGNTEELVHTEPKGEARGALTGPSHGCIDILPADRDDMMKMATCSAA
jgi:hypothetical protein